MIAVIDSGIVMNTSLLPKIEHDIVIPQQVMDEIKSNLAKHLIEMLRANRNFTVIEPMKKYLDQARMTAQQMGQNRLSNQDIAVLATALEIAKQTEIILYSDDYGVRNVAHELGFKSEGITTTGGAQKRYYHYQCRACGTISTEIIKECDICGHTKFKRLRQN